MPYSEMSPLNVPMYEDPEWMRPYRDAWAAGLESPGGRMTPGTRRAFKDAARRSSPGSSEQELAEIMNSIFSPVEYDYETSGMMIPGSSGQRISTFFGEVPGKGTHEWGSRKYYLEKDANPVGMNMAPYVPEMWGRTDWGPSSYVPSGIYNENVYKQAQDLARQEDYDKARYAFRDREAAGMDLMRRVMDRVSRRAGRTRGRR